MKGTDSGARFLVQSLTPVLTACVPLVRFLSCVSAFSSTKWGKNNRYLPGCCTDLIYVTSQNSARPMVSAQPVFPEVIIVILILTD